MNKLISKIVGACLGLSMATAVGVGIAAGNKSVFPVSATEQSVEFDLTSAGTGLRTNISTSLVKYESGSVYASIIKGSGTDVNNYCPGGKTNNAGQTRVYNGNTIEFGVGTGYVITKIDVTATGGSYLAGLDSGSNYSPVATTETSGSTTTATFATAVQARTVTASTTATGRLTKLKIYYDEPSASSTIALNKSAIAVAVGYDATFTVTTLNLSSNFSVTGGDDDYFTTSYTPSSSDGDHVVTLHGVSETTSPITLTVSATGVAGETIDVTVEEPSLYEKVTAASSIKAGKQLVIGNTDGTFVLGKYVTGNNSPALANVPTNDGKLISTYLPTDVALLTVSGAAGEWVLTDQNDKIYYGVSGENKLQASDSATDTWSISISGAGVATITSAASSRSIKKNTSSALFNTYASGQDDVSIYMIPSLDPELQVDVTGSTSLGIGETATLTATKLNGATGIVNWATSNSSILSLSDTTGDEVTVTAGSTLGSATITASLTGCDDAVTSFVVRRGSATEPYTVAQARYAITNGDAGAKTGVYTAGIISQVDSLNSDNSITYWISDDGTATDQMEIYKGFDLGNEEFEAVSDLQAGDEVVVYGNIKKYGETFEYDSGNYLYSFNRPTPVSYTVTYDANGGTCATASEDILAYGHPTFPTPTRTGFVFDGWQADGEGDYYTSENATDYTVLSAVTFVAHWSTPAPVVTGQWVLEDLENLTASDVFVVVCDFGADSYYALSNDNGASTAPSAVEVTVEGGKITSTVADNIKWNLTINEDDEYTFYPDGDSENWLYCTNSNNGVRVGTNVNNTFTVSDGYLHHEGTGRFVGVYSGQDWRCYTSSTAANIAGQSFEYFKFVEDPTPVTVNILSGTVSGNDDFYVDDIGAFTFTAPEGKAFCAGVYDEEYKFYADSFVYDSSTHTFTGYFATDTDSAIADLDVTFSFYADSTFDGTTYLEVTKTIQIINPTGLDDARMFAALINDECHAENKDWDALADLYDVLDAEAQAFLTSAEYTLDGDDVIKADSTHYEIAEAISRYDYMVATYHFTDFMGRASGSNTMNPVTRYNNGITAVVVVFSVISVTTLGGYFLLRKKKEER